MAQSPQQTNPAAPPESGKSSWPKTPAGTIDWETVFEHPETGLLAQFAQARTPQDLRDSAITSIKQLFARKDDETEAARLTSELADLISDDLPADRLALVHYAIAATFREIKTFRQKKAAEYELEKKTKEASERRKAGQSPQSIKLALARKKQRQTRLRLAAAAATILVIAGVGTGGYLYLRGPKYPPRADQILLQQMKSAAAGGAARNHVYGGALQTRRYLGDVSISAENVPVEACATVGVNLVKTGTFSVNGNQLTYGSLEAARTLCQAAKAPIRITWVPVE